MQTHPFSFITDPAYKYDPAYKSGSSKGPGVLNFLAEPAYKHDPAYTDKARIGERSTEGWLEKAKDLAEFAKRGITGFAAPLRAGETSSI